MTTDLEVMLAARREEAERIDAERHEQAVAQATQLVAEAEQRAAAAEQRAAKAVEQAESVRRDADEHAKGLVGNARRNADQVIAEARAHADKVLSEAKSEADRNRRAAQRQVDELVRQRDNITGHLDQLRSLLGATMPIPGLDKITAAADSSSDGSGSATKDDDLADGVPTAGDIAEDSEGAMDLPAEEPVRQCRSPAGHRPMTSGSQARSECARGAGVRDTLTA